MKPEEQFVSYLKQLSSAVTASDANTIRRFTDSVYSPVVRQANNNFTQYQAALVAQIFAEIKEVIAGGVDTSTQKKRLVLKKGQTVKNNNIRFFCEPGDMVPGKYAMLFEHINTHQKHFFVLDFDGKNTFQLPFKFNEEARDLVSLEGNYYATTLLTLAPFMRSYVACRQPKTPLLEAIAAGNIAQYAKKGDIAQLDPVLSHGLNASQKGAVASFTQLSEGIQLLMGPPGTGKTTTITRMIASFLRDKPTADKSILVCGPSNKSVQVIALALKKKFPGINAVLYARESQLDSATKDDLQALLFEQRVDALQSAQVVFATLSATGSKFLKKALRGHIDILIVDEAGQSSEAESFIPLAELQPKKVLLVGDVKQLPPTVLSNQSEQYHHDWSMLHRLQVECGQPHFLLNEQYRMHPKISEFPRHTFYGNTVSDGVSEASRAGKHLVPYKVVDVPGLEELDVVSRSYKNLREAQYVVKLVQYTISKGYSCDDIAVITPYKAQVALIKHLLAQSGISPDALKINTVDSFQGEESPVVFVSLVRANAQMKIGFLEKFQRLNVAITRPQEVLRVVMNGDTLNPLTPRSSFEGDLLYLMKQFSSIVLPKDEEAYDTFSLMSKRDYSQSKVGYRRSLEDYDEPVQLDWEDYGDDYLRDNNGDLIKYFEGPNQIADFKNLLDHYQGQYSSRMGRLPILMLPFLPKGTHIIQDVLDRIKFWRGLSFKGLPADTFKALQYRTYQKGVDEIADYGHPFDEYDNYCSSGYGIAYMDTEDQDLEQQDLCFDGHQFFECDLRSVNFHNSHFKNTLFTGSDVRDCCVNIEKMDAFSKLSFEKAQQESLNAQGLPELKPTDKMVLDAIQRGVYQPSSKDHTTFFKHEAELSNPANSNSEVSRQRSTPR